jgi:sugar lactone lactonase YvrE
MLFALAAQRAVGDEIDTYVGGGNGDGWLATEAILDPRGLSAVGDPQQPHLYVADGKNNRVRRVDGNSGLIETVAGNGVAGYSGDGGSAQNAMLKFPLDVAVDGAGNLYIADLLNNRVRKVSPNGQISTLAGNGIQTYSGEGLAAQASLNNPYGVAVGPDGNVYIADFGNNRIRKVSPPGCGPSNCVISTVAGNGNWGYSGDNGPATSASLRNPADVAFDSAGNMFISDWGSHRIRRVSTNGIITTVAGGGSSAGGTIGDGGPATQGVLVGPSQLAVDGAGNLLIADTNHNSIRLVQASNQFISTVACTGNSGTSGDGGPPTLADCNATWGIAVTTTGTFWLSQTVDAAVSLNNRVRRVDGYATIRSVVGGGLGNGGAGLNALVDPRGGEAVNAGGVLPDLYFADGSNNVVRHVDGNSGIIDTVAGTGAPGYSGDGGNALNATLRSPLDVAYDPNADEVYVSDTFNNVVRKISRTGIISTIAGSGTWGYFGDNGPATQARLASPRGIDVDQSGNVYVADYENNRIRKISGGTITTVAGNGQWGFGGDNGPATSATLRNPSDVIVKSDGTMFIADAQNNRIRRVSPSGIMTTYAGNGQVGFGGDGGLAVLAKIYFPTMLSMDGVGNLYITDSRNNRVRRVDAVGLTISTAAGNGNTGVSGDGGSPLSASFSEPTGVSVDASGAYLFIGSKDDDRVRMVEFTGLIPPTPSFTATAIPPTATNTAVPPTPTRTPTNAATPTRTNTTGPSSASVSGQVKYYANQQVNVPNVELDLFGPTSLTVQTNSSGVFGASSVPMGEWNIAPSKNGGFGSGVSSLDAARVLQVIAGLQSFSSLQRLACDVTGDGNLSALDAVRILQFSAGVIQRMPVADICGSDWLFTPSPAAPGQSVPPLVDAGTCQQGGIFLPLSGPTTAQNFDALLFGDCTGNWSTAVGGSQRRQSDGFIVHAGNARHSRGGRVRVPIYVQGRTPFQALDISVRYDATAVRFASASAKTDNDDTLVSSSSERAGTVTVSLASAAPIDPRDGVVLMLEFRGPDAGQCPAVRLNAARVDERSARVVSHDRCD